MGYPTYNNRQTRDVLYERKRQDEKWGEQNHEFGDWVAILTDEIGEACAEHLAMKFGGRGRGFHLRREMVQVAAVAMAMIECGDRNGWFDGIECGPAPVTGPEAPDAGEGGGDGG